MDRFAAVCVLALALALAPAAAFAQAAGPGDGAPPVAPAAPAPPPPPAAYEAPLLRLSELMGSLHYLRGLCGAGDAAAWRERMMALLESESADEGRKSRLAGAFNRGYRTFQQTYHTCNASAEAAIRAYVEEGRQIARDVTARYSG
jgi:uncharacterized protein (TIGR02301 family)